jgi:hypothetical protein
MSKRFKSASFAGTAQVGVDLPEFTADFSIDGHSHIQSGATAPLPLIWDQMHNIRLSRSVLDTLSGLFLPGGKVQKKKTEEIADDLVRELENSYRDSKLLRDTPYKKGLSQLSQTNGTATSIFTPCIIMPMDMDYAHLGGFPPESTTIYHENTFKKDRVLLPDKMVDGVYYRIREKASADEKDGTLKDVSKERPNHQWVYKSYYYQHIFTVESVKRNPWILIPMFHYDPRRWCNSSGGEMDHDTWVHGPWDDPFRHIATVERSGLFIGFKIYPPLGYKPLDRRLKYLEQFYARCADEKTPILAHCSPGGMTTHEADFYQKRDVEEPFLYVTGDTKDDNSQERLLTYDPLVPEGYFIDKYVHPKNWRPVLEKFPDLKLCLAHFGGSEWNKDKKGRGLKSDWVKEIVKLTKEFPNVYTDMSCYDLKDSGVRYNVSELFRKIEYDGEYLHLKDKIIFGVDWYLSLITRAPGYKDYVESFFDSMGEFDDWQWYRSALVNPATFYGLDNSIIIKNMNKALEDNTSDKSKREKGYRRVRKIKEQVETIKKELEKL